MSVKNVTYFDVEYANSKNKAICQIGIVCEDFKTREPIYPELDIYVNPKDGFDNACIRVHGITASKVQDSPDFPTVWKDIEKYFTNAVVVGHNVASADLDSLVKNLRRYNIDIPELYYICTFELAKENIPRYLIKDYELSTLCEYFDVDMDSEHNAFDDACACSDLFNAMVEEFGVDIDACVRKYEPRAEVKAEAYIDEAVLRKQIREFYGVVRGFSIDNIINQEEMNYILSWKEKYAAYAHRKEVSEIISVIDNIAEDGVVTLEETAILQGTIQQYFNESVSNPTTVATQILDGILKGITEDGKITEEECKSLRQWLYDHIYLSDHFPFNQAIHTIENILEDGVMTQEEADYLMGVIGDMLNPVEALKAEIHDVTGKHVCLSGVFSYGSKADVMAYILDRGGIMDSSVKKSTDYLIIGDEECQAYSNGTYGTKVKTAISYNEKGCNIQIVKETDFFASVK